MDDSSVMEGTRNSVETTTISESVTELESKKNNRSSHVYGRSYSIG